MKPSPSPSPSPSRKAKVNFNVIIVGGSIAGLTLAHCLAKLPNVDFVILEKRAEIAPQEGASIGILPHGGRILDQLGLFEEIQRHVEPLTTAHVSYPDGFRHTNRSPTVLLERFGLPLAFLERRKLLDILYTSLPDTSRVLLEKRVVSVEQEYDGRNSMTVRTHDGSKYHGDLVVGADGVHSRVRREMWRLAELEQPGLVTAREKNSLSSKPLDLKSVTAKLVVGLKVDYACIFGISDSFPNLLPGEQVASLHNGRSFLTFPGKDGRVFWFFLRKLNKQYPYISAPRWSSTDIEKIAELFAADHIWNGVQFGDLWKRRQVVGMTNLEEGVFSTWHCGRVVCIGDSMHKMAPNTGQGANCAIEDAAALANAISMAIKHDYHSSQAEVHFLLQSVSKTRLARIQEIYKSARLVVRLQARESFLLRLVGRYYLPYSGDLPADSASKLIVGGEQLRFLAPSLRSGPWWEENRRRSLGYLGLMLTAGVAVPALVLGLVGALGYLFNFF